MCSYCKIYGHTAKLCADRIAKAKGKYCHECKLSDSHNTDECYKNSRPPQQRTSNTNIRMAVEDNIKINEVNYEDEWASNMYESSSDETGGELPQHF